MWIKDKFIQGRWEEDFSSYEDIKLSEGDLKLVLSFIGNSDILDKLHKITEYRLALEVSKGKITKEEFDWAMRYAKYLKYYFK